MFKDTKGPVGAVEQGKQDTFSLIESMEDRPMDASTTPAPTPGPMAPAPTPGPMAPAPTPGPMDGPIAPVSSQPKANGGESTEEKPECDTCGESKCDKCEESTCDTCGKSKCDKCGKSKCDACGKSKCNKCAGKEGFFGMLAEGMTDVPEECPKCDKKKSKTNMDKWRYTLITTILFLIVVNPMTYKFVNYLAMGFFKIADKTGCPTMLGIFIHAIVFTLLLRGIMELKI
jgi:hypothetical protein